MCVIGIDPGSQRTGWGIVSEQSGVLQLEACGIIRAAASPALSFSMRLSKIYTQLSEVLEKHKVREAAIEQVFTAQNAASALKLGQARGVAVAVCAANGLEIYDYEPTLVKKSLVGNGRAEKEQIAWMVRRLLNVTEGKWPLDTTDALGIAICHLNHRRLGKLTMA